MSGAVEGVEVGTGTERALGEQFHVSMGLGGPGAAMGGADRQYEYTCVWHGAIEALTGGSRYGI